MDVKTGFAALGLGILAFAPATAFAQTTTIQPGSAQTIPEKTAPTSLQNGRSDSLSTKLNESGGVIAPKGNVDPGMTAKAPIAHPNSMPVIPPSATGGDSAK